MVSARACFCGQRHSWNVLQNHSPRRKTKKEINPHMWVRRMTFENIISSCKDRSA
jgi:hypothetical protein